MAQDFTNKLVIGYAPSVPEGGLPLAHLRVPRLVATEHLHIAGNGAYDPNNRTGILEQIAPPTAPAVKEISNNLLLNPTFQGTFDSDVWTPGCGGTGTGTAGDRLLNGSFESWSSLSPLPDSWGCPSLATMRLSRMLRTGGPVRTGNNALVIGPRSAVYQIVSVPGPQPALAEVWARHYSTNNFSFGLFHFRITLVALDSHGMPLAAQSSEWFSPSLLDWQQFTYAWSTLPVGTVKVKLQFETDTLGGADTGATSILLDDAKLSFTATVGHTGTVPHWTPTDANCLDIDVSTTGTGSDHLLIPVFPATSDMPLEVDFTSDNFTVALATDYVAQVDILSAYDLTDPASWVELPNSPGVYPTNAEEFLLCTIGDPTNAEIVFALTILPTSLPDSVVEVAPDPAYPALHHYRVFTDPFRFTTHTTARARIRFGFTHQVGVSAFRMGPTAVQSAGGSLSTGSRLQSAISVDDLWVDVTDNWGVRVKDGVFQRAFTLTAEEPDDSWLRAVGFTNGQNLNLIYTVPEYNLQTFNHPGEHGLQVLEESVAILDAATLLLSRRPVFSILDIRVNGVSLPASGYTLSDSLQGLVTLTENIALDAEVRAGLYYREDRYLYRGYWDGALWWDLDLNPAAGHRYHIGLDRNGRGFPTSDLLDGGVTIYLLPSAAYLAPSGAIVSAIDLPYTTRPTHFVRHKLGTEDRGGALDAIPSAVILARVFVQSPGGIGSVHLLDTRTRGGGFPEDWNPKPTDTAYTWTRRLILDTANPNYLNTGLDVLVGDKLSFLLHGVFTTAGGSATGPDGTEHLSLAIGAAPPTVSSTVAMTGSANIAIANGASFVSTASGRLFGIYNSASIDFGDNDGLLYVEMSITRTRFDGVNWDMSGWDGDPAMMNGVAVVEVSRDILTGANGYRKFTTQQVQEAVNRHIAAGVYPIIRYI